MSKTTPEETLVAIVEKLYRDWFASIPGDPNGFLASHIADDWHYTDVKGEVRGKAEYLPYIADTDPEAAPRGLRDLVVRPIGDILIVHGEYSSPAGPVTDTRFTAVWIQRGRRWQALAHHATATAAPTIDGGRR